MDPYVWFQEHGIPAFTMTALAGKTIPMWVSDFDGSVRTKNPKAQIKVTADGRVKVLIFRKAAPIGARKTKTRHTKLGDIITDAPASYPGAPGRISVRGEGGQIGKGNVGVRWRHPGLKPRLFMNNSMVRACLQYGILPIRVYLADQNWRGEVRPS
jgi:hypothetical protein